MSKNNQHTRCQPKLLKRAAVIGLLDVISILGAFFLGLWLRYDFHFDAIKPQYLEFYLSTIFVWCAVCVVVFALFQLYNSIWIFVSTDELFRIAGAYGVLAALGGGYLLLLAPENAMPRSYYVLGFVFSFICTVAIRFSYRLWRTALRKISHAAHASGVQNVMLIGAGDAGRALAMEFANSEHVRDH